MRIEFPRFSPAPATLPPVHAIQTATGVVRVARVRGRYQLAVNGRVWRATSGWPAPRSDADLARIGRAIAALIVEGERRCPGARHVGVASGGILVDGAYFAMQAAWLDELRRLKRDGALAA